MKFKIRKVNNKGDHGKWKDAEAMKTINEKIELAGMEIFITNDIVEIGTERRKNLKCFKCSTVVDNIAAWCWITKEMYESGVYKKFVPTFLLREIKSIKNSANYVSNIPPQDTEQ